MPKHINNLYKGVALATSIFLAGCAAGNTGLKLGAMGLHATPQIAPIAPVTGLLAATEGKENIKYIIDRMERGISYDTVIEKIKAPYEEFQIDDKRIGLFVKGLHTGTVLIIEDGKYSGLDYTRGRESIQKSFDSKTLGDRISRFYSPQWNPSPKKISIEHVVKNINPQQTSQK